MLLPPSIISQDTARYGPLDLQHEGKPEELDFPLGVGSQGEQGVEASNQESISTGSEESVWRSRQWPRQPGSCILIGTRDRGAPTATYIRNSKQIVIMGRAHCHEEGPATQLESLS